MAPASSAEKNAAGEFPTPPEARDTTMTQEDKIREELQTLFLDLLTASQKLSYELATLEQKQSYSVEELKDLLEVAREVVSNVKRMHRFLEKHGRRK